MYKKLLVHGVVPEIAEENHMYCNAAYSVVWRGML